MTSVRLSIAAAIGLLAFPVFSGAGHALVTEENFVSKTAGDLAALCSVAPTDKLYTAAINFCHGFGSGVYGTLATAQRVNRGPKRVCVPDGTTRNGAIASFISWVGGAPRRAALPVLDGIAAFLMETYPCSGGTQSSRTRRTS